MAARIYEVSIIQLCHCGWLDGPPRYVSAFVTALAGQMLS